MKGEFLKKIRDELKEKEEVREELITKSRELRLYSSKSIVNVHAGKIAESERYLKNAEKMAQEILKYKNHHPEIFYLASDGLQEFVEAYVFIHAVKEGDLPESLPVDVPQAVLPGMADAVGELRRYALTLMIKGDNFEKVENVLRLMEEIYHILIEFDFHDKLTGNLRHKLDVTRNLIERTKSDLIASRVFWKLGSKDQNP